MGNVQILWGTINGVEYYDELEYKHTRRGCGEFQTDADLLAFAERFTDNWNLHGQHLPFYWLHLDWFDRLMAVLTQDEKLRLEAMHQEAVNAPRQKKISELAQPISILRDQLRKEGKFIDSANLELIEARQEAYGDRCYYRDKDGNIWESWTSIGD